MTSELTLSDIFQTEFDFCSRGWRKWLQLRTLRWKCWLLKGPGRLVCSCCWWGYRRQKLLALQMPTQGRKTPGPQHLAKPGGPGADPSVVEQKIIEFFPRLSTLENLIYPLFRPPVISEESLNGASHHQPVDISNIEFPPPSQAVGRLLRRKLSSRCTGM